MENSRSTTFKPLALALFLALCISTGYGQKHSMQSFNFPQFFMRHRNFEGFISRAATTTEKLDTTFKLVKGLADPDDVSFESINFPGLYFRHRGFRIKLERDDGSRLFREDATFKKMKGYAKPTDESFVSFRSYNFPSHFIRHRNSQLWIDVVQSSLDKADSTWMIAPPNI